MARLQILELPEGGGDERPPFILVIDQASEDIAKTLYPQADEGASYAAAIQRLTSLSLVEQIGARAILVFEETVDIPANDLSSYEDKTEASDSSVGSNADFREAASAKLRHLGEQLKEARSWARHGYEIGQKHCGWTDHGVAPDWLTEDWPPHIDSCEHLKQAAEYDEALTRVRNLSTEPEVMNAQQEHPGVWKHGYHCGVQAAKSATWKHGEPTSKPTTRNRCCPLAFETLGEQHTDGCPGDDA